MRLPVNKVIVGDCVEVMASWPAGSVDLVVTSPPYWGLRDYGEETIKIWGGDPECEHGFSLSAPPPRKRSKNDIVDEDSKQATYKNNSSAYNSVESNFCIKCGAWHGSLGLEPHPQLFIDHLTEICREIKRVLKPSGTFYLNLGDTYYGGPYRGSENVEVHRKEVAPPFKGPSKNLRSNWLQPKQKLMIPARVAIALQHDGWILRNDIIWHKPNHMPSSVKDRLTCAYEHVFLFAKQRHYYFDLDAIRVPHVQPDALTKKAGSITRGGIPRQSPESSGYELKSNPLGKNPGDLWEAKEEKLTKHDIAVGRIGNFSYTDPLHTKEYHPMGKNPGDLWHITTTPFPGAHFAVFPPKLINPIIKAGCPRWICSQCGKPRTRITKREGTPPKIGKSKRGEAIDFTGSGTHRKTGQVYQNWLNENPKITVGWSDCGCGEEWTPGVVLDPFGGSGTVGKVARRLGRRFIIIEIKPEYAEMARQRIRGKYRPAPEGVVKLTEFLDNDRRYEGN